MRHVTHRIGKRLRLYWMQRFYKIAQINRKYAKPRITMTPWVKASLLFLFLYLFFLVGVLFYKFWTLVK